MADEVSLLEQVTDEVAADRATATAELPAQPVLSASDPHAQLELFRTTGSEFAFEAVVRAYAGMVYTVCLGVTKNAHDAEDSAQATFLALATQVKLAKPIKFLGPWLRQVAKRTALDHRKGRQRRERREARHGQENGERVQAHDGEAVLDGETYRKALHEELAKLPERYRMPLTLHYLGGLKAEEAAAELNCKPQTLAVRLHRGRKMLAANLSRRGMFLSAEKLGVSMMPLLPATLAHNALAAPTAAAAMSHVLAAPDVVSMIVANVINVLRASTKVALFSKLKLALVVVLAIGPLLANGAKIVHTLSNVDWHLPRIEFNFGKWIAPLIRSSIPSPKMISTNAIKRFASAEHSARDSFFVSTGSNSSITPRLTLISTGDAALDLTNDNLIRRDDLELASVSAGTFESSASPLDRVSRHWIDLPLASITPPGGVRYTLASVGGGGAVSSTVAPEPAVATLLPVAMFALRRRRNHASH